MIPQSYDLTEEICRFGRFISNPISQLRYGGHREDRQTMRIRATMEVRDRICESHCKNIYQSWDSLSGADLLTPIYFFALAHTRQKTLVSLRLDMTKKGVSAGSEVQ